jgi:Raf kinase inhibitor-like YbhB/YbcL family protein
MAQIDVHSPDFDDDDFIPRRHGHDDENVSPALEWEGVPGNAAELLLMCEDPDAPSGTFLHWLVTGIEPTATRVAENDTPPGGREWPNDFGDTGWAGPAPPPGDHAHHYVFSVLALSTPIELPADPSADDVHRAADDISLARGTLTGLFKR